MDMSPKKYPNFWDRGGGVAKSDSDTPPMGGFIFVTVPSQGDLLLQEDGSSLFELEDGSGFLSLES